ncbi:MAG: sulfite exporter TauE/SafE family protein [Bacteroidia bacterium]|nr:sulfite exporter TauE/SafE family protein [Bacteroidia bacterium]MDW8158404.1 sulfite exporter TauE/SafE family protein [Bacteroidia bacterium]
MTTKPIIILLIGFLGGTLSGLVGIGGGIILVPALTFLLSFEQKVAQGTTLAVLAFPVVASGLWEYYKNGYVNIKVAALLACGFVLGGYLGAKLAHRVPEFITLPNNWIIQHPLRKIFGIVLLYIALEMLRE